MGGEALFGTCDPEAERRPRIAAWPPSAARLSLLGASLRLRLPLGRPAARPATQPCRPLPAAPNRAPRVRLPALRTTTPTLPPPLLARAPPQGGHALLKDQLELVKVRQPDGTTRYTIKPLESEFSFDKGFFMFVRAIQLLMQHNKDTILVRLRAGRGRVRQRWQGRGVCGCWHRGRKGIPPHAALTAYPAALPRIPAPWPQVGLAGPSGSGKTAFSAKIKSFIPGCALLSMDNYNDGSKVIDGNFDGACVVLIAWRVLRGCRGRAAG